ncbi:hypothetical protein PoB_002154500 [Plakobranchus ocellatus]|uniref:Uncharacterized protein n=1 Tax=Plakobranchus ocellatus TaxID=259542 RepID=A0AAV3ZIU1_9GAST|nr:hypothetical protein PoB_002154500 [Plakobranchus ocellatus]
MPNAKNNQDPTSGSSMLGLSVGPSVLISNAYIRTIWQENWHAEGANKLHEVLPKLGEDPSKRGQEACRKWKTLTCRLSVGAHWRQQFTCPTIHVLKYSLSLIRAHIKSAPCRSVGAILCVLQPGLTSLALSDKGKGAAIT